MGHLEPHQRITQILKLSLESRYQRRFVIDRYGRGVYWRWICFLPRENRTLKPLSHRSNFGCAKFFVMLDPPEGLFKAGVQVERGLLKTPERAAYQLQKDWDWHRLLAALEDGSALYEELRRVVCEDGFSLFAGNWKGPGCFSQTNFPSASDLRGTLQHAAADAWALFQAYYSMDPEQVKASTGTDLMESVLAVFRELTGVINPCMQIRLKTLAG